jgi:acyl-lipid omega-6 desaturase (Delta-12 desaturase)
MGTMGHDHHERPAATVRALNQFREVSAARSWRLLAATVLLELACQLAILAIEPWPLKIPTVLLAALVNTRLFIFYHDYLHGSLLRDSVPARWLMTAVGGYLLTVPSVWRYAHDHHHQHNGKLSGWFIGEFPLVDCETWASMPPKSQRLYKIARHPLTVVFGYLFLLIARHSISAVVANPKRDWPALVALGVHLALTAGLWAAVGWEVAVFNVVLPLAITGAIGSTLFYVQHNSPRVLYRGGKDWNYHYAALHSTTMLDMPAIMHWFTGNIGYHHVHHMNHLVPFYRLPEAMAAIPDLQHPVRLHLRDIPRCFAVDLWDSARSRMVSFREAAGHGR